MKRTIDWKETFWLGAGLIVSILVAIGPMAAIVGTPSILIWTLSTIIGFVQLFLYTELAALFPNKTGGASIYGAVAWVRYGKLFAPINVWCYWVTWSAALAITAALAGNYIMTAFLANTPLANFSITLLDLSAILPGIKFKIDGIILCSAAVLVLAFYLQHRGLAQTAKVQFAIAILSLIPLFLLTVVPLLTGKVNLANFVPFIPQGTTSWLSGDAFIIFMGGMFIAGYITYGAELAVCYVSEFKDPAKDGLKAITLLGAVAGSCFILFPFTFLGVLGMENVTDPAFVNGDPQAAVVKLAEIAFGTGSGKLLTLMLIFALILAIITPMSSSARTLYQASVDGFFPKFLSKLNKHGVPIRAMWTDLIFNLFLLTLGNPVFVFAACNVAYLICICMDLNAVWMLRKQMPNQPRSFRAPDWLVYGGVPVLTVLNLSFIIFGANVFAPNALWYGLGAIVIIFPIFYYRHYIVDKGVWPESARNNLEIPEDPQM
ncbi:APC family permease [Argonema antarcticum]|uniref:APC family permease n=1 Tax=Argonema antarcticum TaxID=2942763 RepID=UPI002010DA38|nr:APC family permease [Argonema antarcticum]MCL1469522.1 APC family permease [Argonema antarcticum A004/B2]